MISGASIVKKKTKYERTIIPVFPSTHALLAGNKEMKKILHTFEKQWNKTMEVKGKCLQREQYCISVFRIIKGKDHSAIYWTSNPEEECDSHRKENSQNDRHALSPCSKS